MPSLPGLLTRLRKGRRFAAILLHYPNPMAVLAVFLSFLVYPKREKLVVWHHADVLLEERWKRALYALFRPVEEWLFRRADAFIAATPHHVSCSDTFRRFADRTAIVPYAIPDGWFEVSDAERGGAEAVRERMGGAEFNDLPLEQRGRLYRLMASQAILKGVKHRCVGEWLERARQTNPADRRTAGLFRLYRLSPWIAGITLRVRHRLQRKTSEETPFGTLGV